MHLKVTAIAGAIALLAATASKAETIGAPAADVKKGTIGVGLDYGEQEFKLSRGNFAPPNFDYDITDLTTIGLQARYGIMDGVAVSVRASQLSGGKIDGRNQNVNGRIRATDVEGDMWGVGIDAVLWQSESFAVGLMGRYAEYNLEGKETRTGGGSSSGRDNINLASTEGALGVSYTVAGFTPYGGVLAQRMSGKTLYVQTPGGPTNENPLTNRNSTFGYAGIRYQSPWKVSVGAEFRTNSSWFANVAVNF